MAPKKQPEKKADKGQQKADSKKMLKVVEDRTFGLKNKNKSKAVQSYIKGVQQQARPGQMRSEQQILDAEYRQRAEKKKQAQHEALLASLFKGTQDAKQVAEKFKTVDPQIQKQEQKIDLYIDQRIQFSESSKTGEAKKVDDERTFATDIICRHFLDAVEKKTYGWFWVCPNGGNSCAYRHCLPRGFVIRENGAKVTDEDDEEEEPIECVLERERSHIPIPGTPVTAEAFNEWMQKRYMAVNNVEREEELKKQQGHSLVGLTGKDLFTFDPTLFADDDEAALEDDYNEIEDDNPTATTSEAIEGFNKQTGDGECIIGQEDLFIDDSLININMDELDELDEA